MLLNFKAKNYRSIKDEICIDFEATGLSEEKECFIKYNRKNYLPVISISGKNGGGKSNVIRAFWLAVQFVRNAHRTQYENAEVPVTPFEFDSHMKYMPTEFEFEYVCDDIKYKYGFSATIKEIISEYLYYWPKGQKRVVFERNRQEYIFPKNSEKKFKEMIGKAVAPNQLYFVVSCVMNYKPSIAAMKWFRNEVIFSRDYSDLSQNIFDYASDKDMLVAMTNIAKIADIGIDDVEYKFKNREIKSITDLPESLSQEQIQEIEKALRQFGESLTVSVDGKEEPLRFNELQATTKHKVMNAEGRIETYPLPLFEESDGTLRIMSFGAAIEETIRKDGIFVIDEIENRLHPYFVEYIINRFQRQNIESKAQLLFTTHSNDILNRELLRRDQYYLVDKDANTGVTELYSLADFSPRKDENMGRAYMLGKYGAIPYIEEE